MLLFYAILLCAIYLIYQKWKYRQLDKIPSPPGYPIIGHILHVMNPQEKMFKLDRVYSKQFYPIFAWKVLHIRAVVLLHPEDIELVLTNVKHNSKSDLYEFLHPWLGTGLLTSEGAKWQTRRKILTPAFHFNILQGFINIFYEETQRLVDNLKEECEKCRVIDVIPPITSFTLKSIGETSMGTTLSMPPEEQTGYRKNICQIGEILTHRICRPWLHTAFVYDLTPRGQKHKDLVEKLHNFTGKVIDDRKKEFAVNQSYSTRKRLAMLDLLLKYRAEGANIDDEGIREEVDTFMFEGHDTTSMAITYLLMVLANNKKYQDQVYKEIQHVLGENRAQQPSMNDLNELKLLERVIKEGLRLYPSVPFIARMSGEEIKTKTGYVIPKGVPMHIHIYDLHRSPNIYEDPEKFDPDRFLLENVKTRHPFAYIPFSAGSRNCIGQKFALLEIKTVLCGILSNFILEPVTTPENITIISDLVLRSRDPIKVKFVARN